LPLKKSRLWINLRSRLHQHYVGLLAHELKGCRDALDLGCGAEPYLGECDSIESVIGVDGSYSSCRSARRANKYGSVVQAVLPDLPFKERSVDAVTLLQVVEHLPKDVASDLIVKAERLARRKIIITTPNGFVRQEAYDENPFQEHLSGWSIEDLQQRGYTVWGMEGPKAARRKESAEVLSPQRLLSVLISFGLCEAYLQNRPQHAFQLLAVKTVGE
jgi:SAM-dependent methyltransferase